MLLKGLSLLYRAGVATRHFAYDQGVMTPKLAPIPLIGVGNIVAGGAGKTPLVRKLSSELLPFFSVAILSRGYRSSTEKSGKSVKVNPEDPVDLCGDEALLLARQLPGAQVWVGKDRHHSAVLAAAEGAEIAILDDAFQHLRCKKDYQIIAMQAGNLFGGGHFLPHGLLRDHPHHLKKAQLIVIHGAEREEIASITKKISSFTSTPLVFMKRILPEEIRGKRVAIFCALGFPSQFFQQVLQGGAEVVARFFKRDHDSFTPEEIEHFSNGSKADLLLCTEKDGVKLPRDFAPSIPLFVVKEELLFLEGKEHWDKMMITVKTLVKK